MFERHEKGSSIMNAKALIGTVIETIIKVLVLAAAIILVFKGATKAYDFGYRVFADEPMELLRMQISRILRRCSKKRD